MQLNTIFVHLRIPQFAVAAYFISWAFLAGFIMMNIVLAVLVESFTEAQTALKLEQVTIYPFPSSLSLSLEHPLWLCPLKMIETYAHTGTLGTHKHALSLTCNACVYMHDVRHTPA